MKYQAELDKAIAEQGEASKELMEIQHRVAHELREAELRLMAAQKRVASWMTLIALDKPEEERTLDEKWVLTDESMQWMTAPPRIADRIRQILTVAAPESLTVREIREQLRKLGMDLAAQSNPSATIGSVCARFVEQGFAVETEKSGRKAWSLVA